MNNSELLYFKEKVISGPNNQYEFLLHFEYPSSSPICPTINTDIWPAGTKIELCDFFPESLSFKNKYFFISAPNLPNDLRGGLSRCLSDLISQGAIIAWFIYEFPYEDDDDTAPVQPWGQYRVYGVATKGNVPQLAITMQEQESEYWRTALIVAIENFKHLS